MKIVNMVVFLEPMSKVSNSQIQKRRRLLIPTKTEIHKMEPSAISQSRKCSYILKVNTTFDWASGVETHRHKYPAET